MENREILVANTKTQRRDRINTAATTLGELKAELDAAGVDYSGMTFTEGISKTQLLDDDTQLPQNVMYKGQPTNNLVILLTNTKKNIASGAMDRKEAYAIIKARDLQDAIKRRFGRNFTQVSTIDLEIFIAEDAGTLDEAGEENGAMEEDDAPQRCMEGCDNPMVGTLAQAVNCLMDFLISSKALNFKQAMVIAHNIEVIANAAQPEQAGGQDRQDNSVSTSDSGISDNEVTDIINGLNL